MAAVRLAVSVGIGGVGVLEAPRLPNIVTVGVHAAEGWRRRGCWDFVALRFALFIAWLQQVQLAVTAEKYGQMLKG